MDFHSTHNNLPVLLLYNISPDWPQKDIDDSKLEAKIFSEALRSEGHPVKEICLEGNNLPDLLGEYVPENCIVFNWCEEIPGIAHSYDLIAQTLEELGFTFTGADSKALALSQDKRLVKEKLDACGISTPRWQIFTSIKSDGWKSFPAIVKPALDHCSLGVTHDAVVWSAQELAARVGYVIETFHGPALVEEFIDGREFHVSVVGNGRLSVLPVAEMDFSAFAETGDRLCSYESKFDPLSKAYNMIKLHLPAALTGAEESSLKKVTIESFRATDCRDYARLDIRMRDGIFYVLDINPNADICLETSLVMAAEQAGLSYGQLGSRLVNLASKRHPVFGARTKKAGNPAPFPIQSFAQPEA